MTSPAPATLTGQNHISLSLSVIFTQKRVSEQCNEKRYFTGQTLIHTLSCSSAKLLFHEAFVNSADGCSNKGLRELGGSGGEGGWLRWVFIYPSKRNRCLSCRRRSVWINGRFQKASVKNQCPLHTIDGCLAAEERERQGTPVYCEKLLPPIIV